MPTQDVARELALTQKALADNEAKIEGTRKEIRRLMGEAQDLRAEQHEAGRVLDKLIRDSNSIGRRLKKNKIDLNNGIGNANAVAKLKAALNKAQIAVEKQEDVEDDFGWAARDKEQAAADMKRGIEHVEQRSQMLRLKIASLQRALAKRKG